MRTLSDPRTGPSVYDPWANPQCAKCGRFMKCIGHESFYPDGDPIWKCYNPRHRFELEVS